MYGCAQQFRLVVVVVQWNGGWKENDDDGDDTTIGIRNAYASDCRGSSNVNMRRNIQNMIGSVRPWWMVVVSWIWLDSMRYFLTVLRVEIYQRDRCCLQRPIDFLYQIIFLCIGILEYTIFIFYMRGSGYIFLGFLCVVIKKIVPTTYHYPSLLHIQNYRYAVFHCHHILRLRVINITHTTYLLDRPTTT